MPSKQKVEAERFYEKTFEFIKIWDRFAVVKVNETLTLDFMEQEKFTINHYAFKVNDQQFDKILGKVKKEKLVFGAGHQIIDDGKINNCYGSRGVYFRDFDGHILEIMPVEYDLNS